MLTGKQRSYLKSLAADISETVYIGKNELTDPILNEIDDYLNAHELVKVKLQEGSAMDPKEAANIAAEKLGAEYVQAIGRKFILYRQHRSKEDRIIILPE